MPPLYLQLASIQHIFPTAFLGCQESHADFFRNPINTFDALASIAIVVEQYQDLKTIEAFNNYVSNNCAQVDNVAKAVFV